MGHKYSEQNRSSSQSNQWKQIAPSLPIADCVDDLIACLEKNNKALVCAPPGSGKTTYLPLALLYSHLAIQGEICIVQPRRVAAKSVAQWMATLLGEKVGETCGYQVRLEQKKSQQTRICCVTEGVFLRKIMHDPELKNIGMVILDEFHERSLTLDLSLAFLQEALVLSCPDLKCIIMSATLAVDSIQAFFEAPIIQSQGRLFPVPIHYDAHISSTSPLDRIVKKIREVWGDPKKQDGNMLVFLPGKKEIESVYEQLMHSMPNQSIQKLYGTLSLQQQSHVLTRAQHGHSIILSTNLAETSLTIDRISIVIDSGLVRRNEFDSKAGYESLHTRQIAQDSATQRAGRAGRTQQGVCYRLWTQEEHTRRPLFTASEIQNADVMPALLHVGLWAKDWTLLEWLEAPQKEQIDYSITFLNQLGLFDGNRITTWGQWIASLPLDPHQALALSYAHELECLEEMAWLLALLEERQDLFSHQAHDHQVDPVDIIQRVQHALHTQKIHIQKVHASKSNHQGRPLYKKLSTHSHIPINTHVFERTQKVQRYLLSIIQKQLTKSIQTYIHQKLTDYIESQQSLYSLTHPNTLDVYDRMAFALMLAYPHRIGQRRTSDPQKLLLSLGGEGFLQAPSSHATYWVALSLRRLSRQSTHTTHTIYWACAIKKEWIAFQQKEILFFDHASQSIRLKNQYRHHALILSQTQKRATASQAASTCLQQAIEVNPQAVLTLHKNVISWLNRYLWFKQVVTQSKDPRFDTLAGELDQWPAWEILSMSSHHHPLLNSLCFDQIDLKLFNSKKLLDIIIGLTPPSILSLLNQHAPTTYELPTTQKVAITYAENEIPYVECLIQQLFGLTQHPMIALGNTAIQFRLLAPNKKVVQITQDLPGFWQDSYFDVRKELRGRYPKHDWPHKPLQAPAQKGSKRAYARSQAMQQKGKA